MQNSVFKKSVCFFILFSCTHIQGEKRPIKRKKGRVRTIRKELLTSFKGPIVFGSLWVMASGGLGLAVWKKRQKKSVQSNPINTQCLESDTLSPEADHTEDSYAYPETFATTLKLQPKNTPPPQEDIPLPQKDQFVEISTQFEEKIENAYPEKIENRVKLVKNIPISSNNERRVEAKFLNNEDVIYHCSDRYLFKYNILNERITKTQVFEDNYIRFMGLGAGFLYKDRDTLRSLISGFARSSIGNDAYDDIQNLMLEFYKSNYVVLSNYWSIKIYDPTLNQVSENQTLIEKPINGDFFIDPKKKLLAFAERNLRDYNLYVYDLVTGKCINKVSARDQLKGMPWPKPNFHPNGKFLVMAGEKYEGPGSRATKRPFAVWNFRDDEEFETLDEPLATLLKNSSKGLQLVESYDNGNFYVIRDESRILIWNVKQKKRECILHQTGFVECVKICHNEKFLAVAGRFGIKIWHLDSKKLVFDFLLDRLSIFSLDFSPNGDSIAATYYGGPQRRGVLILDNINAMLDEWLEKHV